MDNATFLLTKNTRNSMTHYINSTVSKTAIFLSHFVLFRR
jgi:hypothetical protein